MPKAKLKIATVETTQLEIVAELNDVKLGESKTVGTTTFVEVNYKQAQQLYDMGQMVHGITIAEAKELLKGEKEEQKEVKKTA